METENPKIVTSEKFLLAKLASLEEEIQELKTQNRQLRDQLVTKTIQGEQLVQANNSLQTEILDRQQTETALRLLLDRLSSEKNDLEIILDTTTCHSDTIEALLYDKALSLAHEVKIDGLTQIANRRAFDERIAQEWLRLAREQLPISLLLCDIDFFKRYNDRYGHPAGDECLRAVAKSIESCICRPADLVARYGGEEFAVILPNTLTQGAIFIANKICQTVYDLGIVHESSFVSDRISMSIGISTFLPAESVDTKVLLEAADRGLYLAKNQGRNRAIFSSVS